MTGFALRSALGRPLAPSARLERGSAFDRRTRFRDVSRVRPTGALRGPAVLQFYSAVPNIGNFTAALGVQHLLGQTLEVWNAHQRPIDWEWIHRRYRAVIVGGAGLLHPAFEPFWQELDRACRLPLILWGIGGCWPDAGAASPRCPSAVSVGTRAALVHVRDERSAEFHAWCHAEIGDCPTVPFVQHSVQRAPSDRTLLAVHPELLSADEQHKLLRLVSREQRPWSTDHTETRWWGLRDLLGRRYARAGRVVTTRLHGAIIAASLGIPWIALARDEKLRAFAARSRTGVCVDDWDALGGALDQAPVQARRIDAAPLVAFAERARDALHHWGAWGEAS
ncbi:MAG: polysaccharide pyruvyl transferase family protein [Myxococcota bacterium]